MWLAKVENAVGSQQGGTRPFLIISNDKFNRFSPTVNAYPLTTEVRKTSPVHVFVRSGEIGVLPYDSAILVESVWTLNKSQLLKRYGAINMQTRARVAESMSIQYPFLSVMATAV